LDTQPWWTVVLRGVAALLFGMLCLAAPPGGQGLVAAMFGLHALADGLLALGLGAKGLAVPHGTVAVRGVAALLVGTSVLVWPAITAYELLTIATIWAAAAGALDLAIARAVHGQTASGALVGCGAALTCAVALLASTLAGHVELGVVLGGYGLVVAGTLFHVGLRMRTLAHLALLPRAHSLRDRLARSMRT
jgi:uncharacterized membrane protein HdeD (DUF308 family)